MSRSIPTEPPADDDEQRAEDAARIVRAAGGDRRAAGEYFAHNLPRLSAIARKVAGTSYDAGDLLGEALLIVLSKWADGNGPTENVNAYIAQVMRNRVLDEYRSPRSKVRYLDLTDDPPAREDHRIREIDLGVELDLVRRAMAELPPDHQLILRATVLEGSKPGDLEERLARPVSAIYSLSRRAKANLRRTILRMLLEDGARPECAAAAKRLPENVGDSPETTTGGRSSEHYRTCRRCRRVWTGFGSLAMLGIVPLLVVGDILGAPSASAADTDQDSSPTVPADSSRPRGWMRRGTFRRVAVVLGGAAAVTGISLMLVIAFAFVTETLWFSHEPTATFDVHAQALPPAQVEFVVTFDVVDESWQTSELELTISKGTPLVDAPNGWLCESSGRTASCTTEMRNATGGVFRFPRVDGDGPVEYRIVLTAETADGATVVGTSEGEVVR